MIQDVKQRKKGGESHQECSLRHVISICLPPTGEVLEDLLNSRPARVSANKIQNEN